MNAAPADQRRLLELAAIDAAATTARLERDRPPQAARVQELLARRQTLAPGLAQLQGALDDARTELRRVESDVEIVNARRARDEALLESVSSPKDAAGLERELASLARRLSDLEDTQLELMERVEQAQADLAEREAEVAEVNDEGARLSAEAKQAVQASQTRLAELERDRQAVASALPSALVERYDRLAERGTGAALLRARTCGGCHLQLSGTELNELRRVARDEVAFCPECGCILVRTEESGL